jgi:glycerol-3-phosphate cytidylyltransferase
MTLKRPHIRVLTYGTFDVLHRGHIRLLKRARALGDYLVVGLSTDQFNRLKNKISVFSYAERKLLLESMTVVDQVIPERSWQQKIADIRKHRIDIFVMGSDWEGKFDFLAEHCRVVYLKRTKGISTTKIKRRMARVKHL